ncbi:MAG: GNAT family N-acetyltransferase [Solobacterium sp.]|nr:GNAT family N-acetyltransferase [Erysipelotrichaceae bacterium]MBQ9152176.1 GNAT family N-acetyltransferase [Solobacterium sp.]
MIQRSNPALTGSIRDCWKRCFENEDPNYIEWFFRNVYRPEYGYADVEDSRVVAAVCRIPHEFMFNGRVLKASMLMGISTLPEYRGQGRMGELMHTVLDACSHSELITFIQAYDPKLYEPFGFRTVYYRSDYTLYRDLVKKVSSSGCAYDPSPIDMLKVYSAFIRKFNGFYTRDLDYFVNLKKEIEAEGGKIVGFYNTKNQIAGYATLLSDGRQVKIEECIYLNSTALLKLVNAALMSTNSVHLHVSQAENMKVIFPDAARKDYGHTMARLNDPALFSRLYGTSVNTVEEAFALSRKPLNMNEFM